jgi:hypothetical protein
VTIRGSKRTKLGLRGMVSIGELTQRIDVAGGRAVNAVGFALAGGALLRGALTIDATFTVASPTRCAQRSARCVTAAAVPCAECGLMRSVDIAYVDSRLEPKQLQAIFAATLPLLLEVFNPQGWCGSASQANHEHKRTSACFLTLGLSFPRAALRCARLELTYVDEALRVGRDDKGHTFVLERMPGAPAA